MTYVSIGAVIGIIVVLLAVIYIIDKSSHAEREQIMKERIEWKNERQQLLDRIQAPSFAEYKHQEVRVIKASNGDREPPRLEQL